MLKSGVFKKPRLNIRLSLYIQSCKKFLPFPNDSKSVMTQVCCWNSDISSSFHKDFSLLHCCAEVCPERINSHWNVCNHSQGGQWWEGKWLFPVQVLEEMSTSGSHLRWSPSCQPLWKGSLMDNRDTATISPGGGERTPVEQHGKACIAAAHPKSASQHC